MKLLCKCHGVSGSCSAKICWKTMENFRRIGSMLKEKFDSASHMMHNGRKNRLRVLDRYQKKPSKKDLVYLEESPDFCSSNLTIGSLGTHGRECNKTSYGLDGCTLMCCGRGYQTVLVTESEDCDCKFVWCCNVVCKKCVTQVERYFCNWNGIAYLHQCLIRAPSRVRDQNQLLYLFNMPHKTMYCLSD